MHTYLIVSLRDIPIGGHSGATYPLRPNIVRLGARGVACHSGVRSEAPAPKQNVEL